MNCSTKYRSAYHFAVDQNRHWLSNMVAGRFSDLQRAGRAEHNLDIEEIFSIRSNDSDLHQVGVCARLLPEDLGRAR